VTAITIVGLGKIGLPLAALYAGKGHEVVGADVDPRVVASVNAGRCHVGGEPGLEDAVRAAHEAGRLTATTETSAAVAGSKVVIVVVRVGLDSSGHADYHFLDLAANAIGRGLKSGTLVCLECTVPVGATRNRFGRHLRGASGLEFGAFNLAYSPERVSSGTVFRDLATYPKLVGGVDDPSGDTAAAFYRDALGAEVIRLRDAETAEFAKLAESIYRDVNIGLANELAIAAERLGVSYADAARAGNSQPYSHLHAPGLGVGGHCIPVYPYFLTQATDAPLTTMSRDINDAMAEHGVRRLSDALHGLQGRTVLILGLAYRGGVKEAELSSALLVAESLRHHGARVLVNDSLFSDQEIRSHGLEPSPCPPSLPVDAVVLQAAHPEYAGLDYAGIPGCRAVLDGRGALKRETIEDAGLRYLAIGEP
jgi:nucleotide sugar dehydrogenase